jgi:hypothetical protein
MIKFLIPLLFLAAAAAQASSPIAEVICDDRETMTRKLQQSYGAVRQGRGTRGPEAILEVWMVPSTGAWTLVQSYATGRTCIVAMGENWELLPQPTDPA